MRIAVANSTNKLIGGVETYVNGLLPRLESLGNDVLFLHEGEESQQGLEIAVPSGVRSLRLEASVREGSLAALRAWKPEVLYVQQIYGDEAEIGLLRAAPAVIFLHAYQGACISGTKTFQFPHVVPCGRKFGWLCLAHYYPHRCGGLNPLTMAQQFVRQSRRAEILPRYRVMLTQSEHMRAEYGRQFPTADIRQIALPAGTDARRGNGDDADDPLLRFRSERAKALFAAPQEPLRLLFLGRMEPLKGGRLFLESLSAICDQVRRNVDVTFAGQGRGEAAWRALGEEIGLRDGRVSTSFPGWLGSDEKAQLFRTSDLLVVPSVWPEPFGLVGPEGGRHALPAAAFRVGGIPEWLLDGFNGHVAAGARPIGQELAIAVGRCFSSETHYVSLCRGALESSRRFNWDQHMNELMPVLEFARQSGTNASL